MLLRKSILFASALICALTIEGPAHAEGKSRQSPLELWPIEMKIYFLPFRAQTDVLITPANIERTNPYTIWFMRDPIRGAHPFIKTLRELLQRTPSNTEIDNNVIRLKANFVQDQIWFLVDQKGSVQRRDGKLFHLEQSELDQIEVQIKLFGGVVDMHASKRLSQTTTE